MRRVVARHSPLLRAALGAIVVVVTACGGAAHSPESSKTYLPEADWTPGLADGAGVELVVQTGHSGSAGESLFSPDGTLAVSGGGDERIKLWDVRTKKELRTLSGHQGPVYGKRFSPDGARLYSTSFDRTVRIWNVANGTLERTLGPFQAYFGTNALAVAKDGTIAAATAVAGGKLRESLVRLWSADGATKVGELTVPELGNIVLADDHRWLLASRIENRKVSFTAWDVASKRPLFELRLEGDHQGNAPDLQRLPNGTYLATGLRSLYVIDPVAGTARVLERSTEVVDDQLGYAAVVHGDRFLLTLGKRSRWWDAHKLVPLDTAVPATTDRLHDVSKNGKLGITTRGPTLVLVDMVTGTDVATLAPLVELPHPVANLMRLAAIATNPMQPMVATATADGTLRLWDLRSPEGPTSVRAHQDYIHAITFDPRGTTIATGGIDGHVRIFDVRSLALLRDVKVEGGVSDLQFDSLGLNLACVTTTGKVTTIGILSDRVVVTMLPNDVSQMFGEAKLAHGPQDELFVAANEHFYGFGTSSTSDTRTRPSVTHGPNPIQALAISKAGDVAISTGLNKWLANSLTPGNKGSILLFNQRTQVSKTLKGHEASVRALAFHKKKPLLASGSFDGTIVLWNTADGALKKRIAAHSADVLGLAFTSDGRYLASIGGDLVARLFDAETGALAATLVGVGRKDFVMARPDNTYFASKGGLRGVAFRQGTHVFPFDQWDLQLNRPDKVLAGIGYADPDIVEEIRSVVANRAKRLGVTGSSGGLAIPQVAVLDDVPASVAARELPLRVAARSTSPLARMAVHVNGVPVGGTRGTKLGGEEYVTASIRVPLLPGANSVQIAAIDARGRESVRATFDVVSTAPAVPGALRVLAVGVSDYPGIENDLEYASKDARDVAVALSERNGQYPHAEVKVLTDAEATRSNILAGRAFLAAAKPEDTVIVFFAGHGVVDQGSYYYVPADVDTNRISATAVSYEDIEGLLDGIPAQRRLVLIDSCHAGESEGGPPSANELERGIRKTRAFRGLVVEGAPKGGAATSKVRAPSRGGRSLLPELFADLRKGGAFVIGSSGAAEIAFESGEWKNGVFTYSLLQGLRSHQADADKDGNVTIGEIQQYVNDSVLRMTRGAQRPVARRENVEHDFSIFR